MHHAEQYSRGILVSERRQLGEQSRRIRMDGRRPQFERALRLFGIWSLIENVRVDGPAR